MTTYLDNAQRHAAKIDYYHAQAGEAGYAQASHYQHKLEELLLRAHRSTRGKSDVPAIRSIIENVRPKMDEMRERENAKSGGSHL